MTPLPATTVSRALVDGLVASGVVHACITPGSRSTPITLAFAEHPGVRCWLHLDERSSSYFALGLARATGLPVALVCTSGTAAANFVPAVAEASRSRIPLVVLTADRPPRLRDRGGDQTIDQPGMFRGDVRWAADLPLPSEHLRDPQRLFRGYAERAVRAAVGPLPGPVQLNVPFEEPLVEPRGERPPPGPAAVARPLERAPQEPGDDQVGRLVEILAKARRPLVVAGPETGGLPLSILGLAARAGAPLLADPLSGLRLDGPGAEPVIGAYDAFLRDPGAAPETPDCVVRFGGPPTSKALNQYLARAGGADQVLVDLPGSARDPDGTASLVIAADAAPVAGMVAAALPAPEGGRWVDAWKRADRAASAALRDRALAFTEPFEGRVFIELQEALPPGATIVAGNSMPVRDLDAFLAPLRRPLTLVANRGVNGIDGVNSSALGAAAAGTGPVVLVVGDISFYHDLNGLWAARRHGIDLTVVLVNNDGGGIFHYLPQAGHGAVFEDWFGTPTGLDFSHAVSLFGGRHRCVSTWDGFGAAVAAREPGLRVFELRTDRYRNAEMHREAWAAAGAAARAANGATRG